MRRDDLARLSGTYPMMLLAWVVLAAAATSPAIIGARALSTPAPDPSGALLGDALAETGHLVGASWLSLASPLLLLLLASPLLSVAWLRGLGRREPLRASLAHGARRYGAAVLSSLVLLPVLGVGFAILGGLPAAVDAALSTPNVRTRDLSMLAATLPGLIALATWATWHDLARAALATTTEGGLRATLGAIGKLRPLAILRYALFWSVGLALAGLGVAATHSVTSAVAVVLGQLFVLARLGVRGLYLSGLVRT